MGIIKIKNLVFEYIRGVRFEDDLFRDYIKVNSNLKSSHVCMDFSVDDVTSVDMPYSLRLENGLGFHPLKNKQSPYSIEIRDGKICIIYEGKVLSIAKIPKTPEYYKRKTTDGVWMKTISVNSSTGDGPVYGEGRLFTAYSNECALQEKGKICLFCNINATKARFSEKESIEWKTPRQIAETAKASYDEGYNHLTISGGFVPERREFEYYLDTIETIREYVDDENFKVSATVGAPKDLTIIEKYKEAGFSSIAMNIEVWNKDFYNYICPGKAEVCGGYEHWIEALEYAVQVFGKGKVRSQFVQGLQPKEDLLEGIETLAEKGIVAYGNIWAPNIGSKFEGHRTPSPDWHWELTTKAYQILRKYGRTYEDLYDSGATPVLLDMYRINDGTLPF